MNRSNVSLARAIGFGSLAAAACVAVIYFSWTAASMTPAGPGLAAAASFAAMLFVSVWALAALAAGTLGLAWHAVALKFNWTHWFGYMFAGLVLGACLPAAFTAPVWIAELINPPFELWGRAFSLIVTVVGAFVGLLTALFAWLIRRPDRGAANPVTAPT